MVTLLPHIALCSEAAGLLLRRNTVESRMGCSYISSARKTIIGVPTHDASLFVTPILHRNLVRPVVFDPISDLSSTSRTLTVRSLCQQLLKAYYIQKGNLLVLED